MNNTIKVLVETQLISIEDVHSGSPEILTEEYVLETIEELWSLTEDVTRDNFELVKINEIYYEEDVDGYDVYMVKGGIKHHCEDDGKYVCDCEVELIDAHENYNS